MIEQWIALFVLMWFIIGLYSYTKMVGKNLILKCGWNVFWTMMFGVYSFYVWRKNKDFVEPNNELGPGL